MGYESDLGLVPTFEQERVNKTNKDIFEKPEGILESTGRLARNCIRQRP